MTTVRPPPPGLAGRLDAWAKATYGDGATTRGLQVLPGHAGLTYGFAIVDATGAVTEELVLRLPPAGVRRQGNTDVLRQAPLIDALDRAGVPVAPVRFASDDEQWFGVPYLAVARMPGRTVSIDTGAEPPSQGHFDAAVRTLAKLHAVAWERELADWSAPRSYGVEVRSWDRAIEKAGPADWRDAADRVRTALIAAAPDSPRVGILHGDYQFSNLLFEGENLVAVLDWEISGIGPQLLDLGWFLVINDQRSWAHEVALDTRPGDEELRRTYGEAAGHDVDQIEFGYAKAVAAYRFAAIAALNLSLHRSGRRVDEHWELIAPSIPILLARAGDDLAG
jgi:aminoglycoside phosphotransferase (APT) family kinase protein